MGTLPASRAGRRGPSDREAPPASALGGLTRTWSTSLGQSIISGRTGICPDPGGARPWGSQTQEEANQGCPPPVLGCQVGEGQTLSPGREWLGLEGPRG